MTEGLAELINLAEFSLAAAFLVFLRIGSTMALLPAFGEMMVPVRVKLALTLALCLIVVPAVMPAFPEASFAPTTLLAYGGHEILVGLLLGLALRMLVFALQVAGTIAAQSTSLSQLFGGQAVDPQPALGAVLVLAGIALATLLGLHTQVVVMLIESYMVVPPGIWLPTDWLTDWGVSAIAHAFRLAVVLAMPFMLASLLYNLALGVINRAMPQLMVAFVGAPAITLGALILLAVSAPVLLSVWADAFGSRIAGPFGAPDG